MNTLRCLTCGNDINGESLGEAVRRISVYLDAAISVSSDRELGWERIGKIAEELGEVTEAWVGAAGTNPRKGQTHTIGDVMTELLDVATCALGAWEHLRGNQGDSDAALTEHAVGRAVRMGVMS